MKHKYPPWRAMIYAVSAILISAFCSCGNEGDADPDDVITGSVVYAIRTTGGSGTGSSESPVVVQNGDTLNLAINQKSSYTDPDGSVYICEPEAVIKLSTFDDTLYVKDFQTLLAVEEISNTDSLSVLGEKTTKQILQTFNVGGKEVTFNLAYDIFKHVNSLQESVEMPYIKVNSANYGAAQADETRASAVPMAVSGIRITPHTPQTRGVLVDSTTYDVNVAFNLDLESVHAKEAQNQTLSFEIKFMAVVESTTEYADPTMQFSYQLQVLGGTESTASPFMLNLGETMSLEWKAKSQYNYFSIEEREGMTVLHEPKASVTLKASKEMAWITSVEELEQLIASEATIHQSGSSPSVMTGQKVFSMGDQDLTLDWSYNAYDSLQIEGVSVAIPYLMLTEPEVVSVNATELTNVTIPGKQAKVYEVTVRLSQKLTSVNAPDEQSKTIEYVVKFNCAFEVKLLKVVYRKDWEWVEAHDNIPKAYYAMVHRDRIYSTGETFTDTFRDMGHLVSISVGITMPPMEGGKHGYLDVFYTPLISTREGDSLWFWSGSCCVPDLSLVVLRDSQFLPDVKAGEWEHYEQSKRYNGLDISLNNVEVIGADSVSTGSSGWYMLGPKITNERKYSYDREPWPIYQAFLEVWRCDQFLVIDGRMINFLEFYEPIHYNFKVDSISMSNGAPGIVLTHEARFGHMGRNFHLGVIDTIYQQEP